MFSVDVFPTLSACVKAQEVLEISPQKIALSSPLVTTSSCRYQADCPFTLNVWLQWQPLRPPCLKQTSLLPQRVEFITVRQCRVVKPGSATGHYFLLMLCSFTNQVLAQLVLFSCGHELRPAGVNGWFQVAPIETAVSKQTSPLPQRAISTSSIWSTWRC